MRVEWNCAITGSGAQSVMICGVHQMQVLLANSLVTRELVGITFITSDINDNSCSPPQCITTVVYLVTMLVDFRSSSLNSLCLSGARAFSSAFFGRGTGGIYLDNLGCRGSESRLIDCVHSTVGIHNCDHGDDAGLRCQRKSYLICNCTTSTHNTTLGEQSHADCSSSVSESYLLILYRLVHYSGHGLCNLIGIA